MNKKVILLVLVLGLFLVAACSQEEHTDELIGGGSPVVDSHDAGDDHEETDSHDDEVEFTGETVVIEMVAKNWEFIPNEIRVNEGDRVELHIESVDVTHGFMLPEFGVNVRLVPGSDVHVDFVADKKGEFSFFCNVPCGRGHGGMVGLLIVE